ncbi:MAG: D-glycero-beta-D-manno-heptose-7-phosphate kinase [Candidatus Meridianibacter frigidus]|nr:MAG: D-glycero-beta-D-manno-heptose-7-phosphate kinase [Candidatus Eremiobacteraeota bacterium]
MSTIAALSPPDARTFFERMRGRSIMVIGDVMLDEWIWGAVSRISPEAPVPVVAVSDHSFTLGGAGNVVSNLCALGAQVRFVGAIGNDRLALRIHGLLEDIGVSDEALIKVDDRPTTRKTRIVAHNQQVVRADWESTQPLEASDRERICALVRRYAGEVDGIVLSDYAKGLLSRDVVDAALPAPVVVADPKPQNLALFAGVTCVAPNAAEAAAACGITITDDESLETAGSRILELLHSKYVVVTRGEAGMSLFGGDGERLHVPSVARSVFDVSGAGDTAVAVLALALAARAPIGLALQLANFAAGTVVEKLGTATASAEEILELVNHDFHA